MPTETNWNGKSPNIVSFETCRCGISRNKKRETERELSDLYFRDLQGNIIELPSWWHTELGILKRLLSIAITITPQLLYNAGSSYVWWFVNNMKL